MRRKKIHNISKFQFNLTKNEIKNRKMYTKTKAKTKQNKTNKREIATEGEEGEEQTKIITCKPTLSKLNKPRVKPENNPDNAINTAIMTY